jgi:hypothetical protein
MTICYIIVTQKNSALSLIFESASALRFFSLRQRFNISALNVFLALLK